MPEPFESITSSLGRTKVLTPPSPPAIDPAIARLTRGDADLPGVFRQRAGDAKMKVIPATADLLTSAVLEQLQARGCKTAIVTEMPCLHVQTLIDAGISVSAWRESTLDASYDVDVGITDVYRAVAETGSIVIRESETHGRAVSLVPPIHFAIVKKSQILPDLIDLMADVAREGTASGIVIITGPSKTADIEMNLVTGVHGPGEVVIFLID